MEVSHDKCDICNREDWLILISDGTESGESDWFCQQCGNFDITEELIKDRDRLRRLIINLGIANSRLERKDVS